MANPIRGEVEFEAQGKVYTLRFSYNAMVEIEEKAGKPFPAISAELTDPEKVSLKTLRLMFWGALRDRHPDVTVEQSGELIDAAGGMIAAVELVSKALERTVERDDARPRKPVRRQ